MPAPSFPETIRADRRLCVLQILDGAADYSAHPHLLRAALGPLGHQATMDMLRGDLAWLAEQGLVAITDVSGASVARLTEQGEDVARGRALLPGVARPHPID